MRYEINDTTRPPPPIAAAHGEERESRSGERERRERERARQREKRERESTTRASLLISDERKEGGGFVFIGEGMETLGF